jgi:hypothetical protein
MVEIQPANVEEQLTEVGPHLCIVRGNPGGGGQQARGSIEVGRQRTGGLNCRGTQSMDLKRLQALKHDDSCDNDGARGDEATAWPPQAV